MSFLPLAFSFCFCSLVLVLSRQTIEIRTFFKMFSRCSLTTQSWTKTLSFLRAVSHIFVFLELDNKLSNNTDLCLILTMHVQLKWCLSSKTLKTSRILNTKLWGQYSQSWCSILISPNFELKFSRLVELTVMLSYFCLTSLSIYTYVTVQESTSASHPKQDCNL